MAISNEILWAIAGGLCGALGSFLLVWLLFLRDIDRKLAQVSGKLDLLISIRDDLTKHKEVCAGRYERRGQQIEKIDAKAEKSHTRLDILKSRLGELQ